MAWYKTGTVAVTNGSTTVTGTGTDFITAVRAGDGFKGPDGEIYEIASITSTTALVLAEAYGGSTATGQSYAIVTIQSRIKDLADSATTLVNNFSAAGAGNFEDGSVAAPGIAFSLDLNTGIYRIGNDNLGIAVGGTKVMDLSPTAVSYTCSVGIGTSSPTRTLHCKGASGVNTVAKFESGATTGTETVYLQLSSDGQSNADSGYISYKNTREMGFWTVDTERMTIDSSGNVLVGGTSLAQADSLGITQTGIIYSARASGSGQSHNIFYNGSSVVGSITTTTSSTSYNTSSDYRLKENVVELTGATERLKQLKPSRFNFIADADTTVDGFLAHEVADIVPEAISGTKDAVDADGNPEYQGIDQSKLVPLLVATIKELEARITQLENN